MSSSVPATDTNGLANIDVSVYNFVSQCLQTLILNFFFLNCSDICDYLSRIF